MSAECTDVLTNGSALLLFGLIVLAFYAYVSK